MYCSITLLLRALIEKDLRNRGLKISMERLHDELTGIKQVVNVFCKNKVQNRKQKASGITKMNELQAKLFKMFEMNKYT